VRSGKLRLNDSALVYSSESSVALGFGFRCGFLGLLHMEIIQERIRREYDVEIISTYPERGLQRVQKHNGDVIEVDNPVNLPDPGTIEDISEPTIKAAIHIPNDIPGRHPEPHHGKARQRRPHRYAGRSPRHAHLHAAAQRDPRRFQRPAEEHHPWLRFHGLRARRIPRLAISCKMDILVNGTPVDAFASIVHRTKAEGKGRALCEKLADIIPPQMFKIAVQAAIGGKIIARDNVREMRKDVTSKCYGGDISRKRKLLDKQKEGKKKMKLIGKVSIPPDAFIQVLKTNS
jgi:GTP-binding protein LepA